MRRVGGNVLVLSAALASLSIEHSAHNTPISPAASATCNCGGLISHLFYDIKMSVFDRLNLFSLRCMIYLHVFTHARSCLCLCLCLRAQVRVCAHTFVFARTFVFVFARSRSCLPL